MKLVDQNKKMIKTVFETENQISKNSRKKIPTAVISAITLTVLQQPYLQATANGMVSTIMDTAGRDINLLFNDPKVRIYAHSLKNRDNYQVNALVKKQVDSYIPKPAVVEETQENIRDIPKFNMEKRENDFAIIIGIENYQNIQKSEYSLSDAGLVKDYFKALGFQERNIAFIVNENATKSGIEKIIEAWLPNRIEKNSHVFVYYSGHGAPNVETGESYLVPYDGDQNYISVTGYPLKKLYKKLGSLQVAEVVVLLDSCFSGSGSRSIMTKGARPLVMMTENYFLPENMAVLSATHGTQISISLAEKGHGLFTYYFLKAIKNGKANLLEIYDYIKPRIEDEAKYLNVQQSPGINPDANKIKGRFVFLK